MGLLAAGVSAEAIHNDLKAGRFRPVYRGVYALGPLSPRGRHVAALMAGGSQSVLCLASTLAVYGLMSTRATIDVTTPRERRDRAAVRFHLLSLAEDELSRRDGLPTTTIPRALLDIASTGAPIADYAHEAIARHLTTQPLLAELAARHHTHRGAPALRHAAGEPHVRSKLERRFHLFLTKHGLPRPIPNHPIGPYTVDGYYPQQRLVIELDEHGHQTPQAFERDRRRDRYLTTRGYRVIRITDHALTHDHHLAHDLRRALANTQ